MHTIQSFLSDSGSLKKLQRCQIIMKLRIPTMALELSRIIPQCSLSSFFLLCYFLRRIFVFVHLLLVQSCSVTDLSLVWHKVLSSYISNIFYIFYKQLTKFVRIITDLRMEIYIMFECAPNQFLCSVKPNIFIYSCRIHA